MPTYWKKYSFIHFAATKKHIGLYPGIDAVLIEKIAKWCLETGKHAQTAQYAKTAETTWCNINDLIDHGIFVDGVFTQDYVFDSPSAAAVIVGGRSANGRREWTTLDGRQYGKVVGHQFVCMRS